MMQPHLIISPCIVIYAYINRGFTSPTYYPEGSGFLIRMLRMVGADMRVGRQEEALSSDMRVGSCWAMVGQKGRLTVQLSEPIRVSVHARLRLYNF